MTAASWKIAGPLASSSTSGPGGSGTGRRRTDPQLADDVGGGPDSDPEGAFLIARPEDNLHHMEGEW
ncbi:MAG TPA: hypothetical protein VGV57_11715 [Thermoleophilaceae bacterium]|nr:hypothetical protein [Thermoleophilaceae bacterium]